MWLIMRDNELICEWKNNIKIIGGYFTYLFLRGNEILLKLTLLFGLIRHLILYYDGRFENSKFLFIFFIINK